MCSEIQGKLWHRQEEMSVSLHKSSSLKSTNPGPLQTIPTTRPHPHFIPLENSSLLRAAWLCGEGSTSGRQRGRKKKSSLALGTSIRLKLMKKMCLFPGRLNVCNAPSERVERVGGEAQTELHLKGKGRRKFFHLPGGAGQCSWGPVSGHSHS